MNAEIRRALKVLRDVVHTGADGADLKEALKGQLARYRIPYTATLVNAALDRYEQSPRRLSTTHKGE